MCDLKISNCIVLGQFILREIGLRMGTALVSRIYGPVAVRGPPVTKQGIMRYIHGFRPQLEAACFIHNLKTCRVAMTGNLS